MGSGLRYTYKTEPFSHQKRALNKIFKRGGVAGLFMEMGTGKTKVAIDWAGIGYYNYGVRRVLVICPLSVVSVWINQIKMHSPIRTAVYSLAGRPTQSRINMLEYSSWSNPFDKQIWMIINYEGIWREGKRGTVSDAIIRWKPDLVICDESHRLKSASAKQSRHAYKIGKRTKQRLILTGTPITKSPLDLFGQFRFLDPTILPKPLLTNYGRFKHRYAIFGGFGGFQVKGYKKLPELVQKTKEATFRIKKDQCLDLPEKLFQDVEVTLSAKARKFYDEMAEEMIIEIEETHATAAIILTKLLRLSQITSGFIKDVEGKLRVFDDTKLTTCLDLLKDMLEEGQKAVIFVRFRKDISRLASAINDAWQIDPLILSGSVPADRRNGIVESFKKKKHPIFIAQIQAGSLGIDLTPASVAIFYSVDYNAGNYWQAQDRLHRQGQTQKVTYYNIIARGTIDREIFRALEEKKSIAEYIVHNPQVLSLREE